MNRSRTWAILRRQHPSAGRAKRLLFTPLASTKANTEQVYVHTGGDCLVPCRDSGYTQPLWDANTEMLEDVNICMNTHSLTSLSVQTPQATLNRASRLSINAHMISTYIAPHVQRPGNLREPVTGLWVPDHPVISPVFAPWLKVTQRLSSHRPGIQDTLIPVQRDQPQPQHLKTTQTREGRLLSPLT